MKKLLIFLVLAIAFASCLQDNGEYEYDYLGEVEVSNFENANFTYKYGSTVNIQPQVVTTIPADELSYMWLMHRGNHYDTLAYTKDLNIEANFVTGYAELRVIHNPSEVHFTFTTIITVSEPLSFGWGILSNTNDASPFSFISSVETDEEGNPLYEYFPDNFIKANGAALPPNARKLSFGGGNWIVTYDDEGLPFELASMRVSKKISEYFNTTDYLNGAFAPGYIGFTGQEVGSSIRFVTSGGDLFGVNKVPYDPQGSYGFSTKVEGEYYFSDVFTIADSKIYLHFDEDKKRYLFVDYNNSRLYAQDVIQVDGIAEASNIDLADLGMECLFLSIDSYYDKNAKIFSFLKDEQGEYHLHIMDKNPTSRWWMDPKNDLKIIGVQELNAGLFNNDTRFVVPNGSSDIYIVTGNKIHMYNTSNDAMVENWLEMPGDILAFNMFSKWGVFEYAVATADGENSTVTVYSAIDNSVLTTETVSGHVVDLMKIYE